MQFHHFAIPPENTGPFLLTPVFLLQKAVFSAELSKFHPVSYIFCRQYIFFGWPEGVATSWSNFHVLMKCSTADRFIFPFVAFWLIQGSCSFFDGTSEFRYIRRFMKHFLVAATISDRLRSFLVLVDFFPAQQLTIHTATPNFRDTWFWLYHSFNRILIFNRVLLFSSLLCEGIV